MIDLWKASRSTGNNDEDTGDSDDSSLPSLEGDYLSNQSDIQDNQISSASLPAPTQTAAQDELTRRRAISDTGAQPSLQTNTVQKKETTECDCSKNEQHFPTVVLDHIYPTTIETMYHLLYNSNFMNQFLSEVEKSTGKVTTIDYIYSSF